MTILIHGYKPYRKGKFFTTFWFVTFMKKDPMKMLDVACARVESLLGYKIQSEINDKKERS